VIRGRYFDARQSTPHAARVEIGADRKLRLVSDVARREVPLDSVRISDRIGDVPRRLAFDDGSVFETPENDAVDMALDAAGQGGFARRLHRSERFWGIAVAALLAVALLSWAFVKLGIPALAASAARAMPPSVDAAIGSEGLELLDKVLLSPTRLPASRQASLRRRLAAIVAGTGDAHDYRLEFRRDEEIDAVLAHEVGHVRGRHSLRILLQNAGVAALSLAVLGDIGSSSSLAAAIPVLLVQAEHSRAFEREADAYAREWLRREDLPESHFDAMMCRLAKDADDLPYLSTHPPLEERARCD
jgi:hypothetical protein